jgi:hypothetical protein
MIEIKLPDLSRVVLEPGDVLFVRTQRLITMREAHEIHDRLCAFFPGNDVVVHDLGFEFSRLAPEPGDTLLVRCDDKLSSAQAKLIKVRLRFAFPTHEIVMISDHAKVAVERDGERVGLALPADEVARRFAEANDRPNHMGPA